MSVREAPVFADLVRDGPATVPCRVALLRDHRQFVAGHIDQLQQDLTVTVVKIDTDGNYGH